MGFPEGSRACWASAPGPVAGLVGDHPVLRLHHPGGSAVVVGVLAGAVPFFACTKIKNMFGYDDALDTFGVHGVGGIWAPC